MKRSTAGFKKYFGGINKCRKTRFGKVCNGRGNAMKKVSRKTMLRLARQIQGQKKAVRPSSHIAITSGINPTIARVSRRIRGMSPPSKSPQGGA
jgi:hypothetical protein